MKVTETPGIVPARFLKNMWPPDFWEEKPAEDFMNINK